MNAKLVCANNKTTTTTLQEAEKENLTRRRRRRYLSTAWRAILPMISYHVR